MNSNTTAATDDNSTVTHFTGDTNPDLDGCEFNGSLRVVILMRDGGSSGDTEPWFVASDVCKALGYTIRADGSVNVTQATKSLLSDELSAYRGEGSGYQRVIIISEAGLFRMLKHSRKPTAKAFKEWITSEVLPSINGGGDDDHDESRGKPTTTMATTPTKVKAFIMALVDRLFPRCKPQPWQQWGQA